MTEKRKYEKHGLIATVGLTPEQILENRRAYFKQYRKDNREKINEINRRYRATPTGKRKGLDAVLKCRKKKTVEKNEKIAADAKEQFDEMWD